MKQPEDVKVEFVRDWTRKAESDFRTAQHLCAGGVDYATQGSLEYSFLDIGATDPTRR